MDLQNGEGSISPYEPSGMLMRHCRFGRHGGSEFFIGVSSSLSLISRSSVADPTPQAEDRPKPTQTPKGPLLPVELVFLSKMFPFKSTSSIDDDVRRHVRARLPPREVAWELAHQHYGHIAWSYVLFTQLLCAARLDTSQNQPCALDGVSRPCHEPSLW